jgi:hypothetical protein
MYLITTTTQSGGSAQWVSSTTINPLSQYFQFGALPPKSELGSALTMISLSNVADDGLWGKGNGYIFPLPGPTADGQHWSMVSGSDQDIQLDLDNSNLSYKWLRLSDTDITVRS